MVLLLILIGILIGIGIGIEILLFLNLITSISIANYLKMELILHFLKSSIYW